MSEKNERLNNRNRQLASAIDFLRIVPDPDFESKKNTLVARDVVRNEIDEPLSLILDEKQRVTLLRNGREDAANVLLHTIGILGEIRRLNRLVGALIVVVLCAATLLGALILHGPIR